VAAGSFGLSGKRDVINRLNSVAVIARNNQNNRNHDAKRSYQSQKQIIERLLCSVFSR
jgi:hypothetical protein